MYGDDFDDRVRLARDLDREADYNRDQAVRLSYRMTAEVAPMVMAHVQLAGYLRREAAALRDSTPDQ